ncbi:MAG TPA: cation-translocating P-type ATPase [Terriglobales bacterium]|jgi:heavy metal translocating P-type ATPase|nr:cation-translocating P-type ATPase [Terriglobales bacterium]
MSIPQPIEKLDPNAPASGHSQERVERVAPNAMRHDQECPSEHDFNWTELLRIAFVALAAAAVWFRVWEPFPRISVIGILATLIGGYPIFKEAFENIVERKMTMELSMTIALLSALAIGEFFTALVITAFVLGAEVLEGLTVGRGRRAIQDLLDFLPRIVLVRRNNEVFEIPAGNLLLGDSVIVKPGGRIPVDGLVLSGRSFVEQAAITGEAMPVEKSSGNTVYAGTINQSGALEIRADKLGRDTTFGRIIEAVERAEKSRAPIQKTADRLAGYLVYFALGAAVLTFIITHNVRSTISVVIVAGACGIAAGTPLAILGAIGRAAHHGAIIKGGLYLEALSEVDTVLLDKTGTLTFGTPQIRDVVSVDGSTQREILAAASIAECKSEHPLAKAIIARAIDLAIPVVEPDQFAYQPGKGVAADYQGEEIIVGSRALLLERGVKKTLPVNGHGSGGVSEVYVAKGGRVLGTIRIADVLRPEAKSAVAAMREMGLKTILLSGDAQEVTTLVGRDLGVDEAVGELLPDQKARWVTELRGKNHKVAMLGDGINDAPALVQANVGIAMGSGTDVARESADVILIGSDLSKFVEALRIARRCRGVIMQNFAGTLIVDSIGVGMAAFGFLNPLLAAFIHVTSELAFILNSTRLLPRSSAIGR